MARPFYRLNQLALVLGTGARDAPGDDLPLFGHKPMQQPVVLVVNVVDTVFTEPADLFAWNQPFAARLSDAVSALIPLTP